MQFIQQAISHTPLWVLILFVYLMKVGFEASRERVVELKKMFVIPIIFTLMSLHTLITSFTINAPSAGRWLFSIIIGAWMGWWQVSRYEIKVDKQQHLFQIPGTWSTLVLIIIIFITKYYFGYELASDPALAHQTNFEFTMLGISGICTGLFIGRLSCYLFRMQKEVQTNLSLLI